MVWIRPQVGGQAECGQSEVLELGPPQYGADGGPTPEGECPDISSHHFDLEAFWGESNEHDPAARLGRERAWRRYCLGWCGACQLFQKCGCGPLPILPPSFPGSVTTFFEMLPGLKKNFSSKDELWVASSFFSFELLNTLFKEGLAMVKLEATGSQPKP